jgi:hypothetical protein
MTNVFAVSREAPAERSASASRLTLEKSATAQRLRPEFFIVRMIEQHDRKRQRGDE